MGITDIRRDVEVLRARLLGEIKPTMDNGPNPGRRPASKQDLLEIATALLQLAMYTDLELARTYRSHEQKADKVRL